MKFGTTKNGKELNYLPFNRRVNRAQVRRLKRSISNRGLLQPVNVVVYKGKLYILDGQHRAKALIELGMEVPYYISQEVTNLNDIVVSVAEAQKVKSWSNKEFLSAFGWSKNSHYIAFKEIMDKFGISAYTIVLTAIGNGTAHTKAFKEGELVITNRGKVERVLKQYLELLSLQGFPTNVATGRSLINIIANNQYNHKKLVKSVARYLNTGLELSTNETAFKSQMMNLISNL